ncbi:DUF349 domain-containing protein [Pseudoalteromonas sp. MEBiC 03607]|uniref:DUF349 domain-containing protein n=1 Tax=Pseudoalteromonas sp. MEBiC 03607 TaxID=2563601 RepID=UPI0010939FB5|nr:DUF349 domain-containing protein [Pseudoalteromonas sp. MEBiC 03607]TGV20892.1 DUF349 domain-containing protein [Pseudoalteromonas sp. MEBiC 03607]
MIFKHLFTPKWKHPKSQVRLAAVERLDTERDLSILNSIALEDSSAEIRKKALNKVNDLVLWWQVYKQDQALKEIAEQHINQAVLNTDSKLDASIKNEFIERYAPVKTLEKLAFAEKEIQVRVKLLKRLANPSLIDKAFKEGREELQLQLVELVINHQLAKPLLKHAKGEAHTQLAAHLENERLAVEMPAKVEADTRVILAKLNALRDKNDFQLVSLQHAELLQQWQAIELKWLSDEQVSVLDKKYSTITQKLEAHIATLSKEHEAMQQALAEQQRQVLALATLEAIGEEIENALQLGLETPEQIQQDWLEAKVAEAKDTLAEANLVDNQNVRDVKQHLSNLFKQVEQLPQLVTAIAEFKAAFDALKAITTTEDENEFDGLKQQFEQQQKVARKKLASIPSRLQGRFKANLAEAVNSWQQAMAPLTNKFEKNQQTAKRKARDVKRLIEQGRFNVAFGVFKGFEELYDTLTDYYKQPLNSLKADLEAQLAEAKDWQKYASAPKRDALLAEVNELAAIECTDPKQRAEQVKQLRRRWNELGRLDTDAEKQQGELFDQQIELLFAPCREYFAEQEQQREQAKAQRVDIISQMQQLNELDTESGEFDWKQFESKFNRVVKAWRSAGNVDPKTYRELQAQFKAAQSQVQGQLVAFHKANAEQKAALVEQATLLSQSDDLAAACQELKALQQTWQTIGFAGMKAENTLWQQFRRVNDDTFAKRSAEFEQQKQVQQQNDEVVAEQLTELETALESVVHLAQLKDLTVKLAGLEYSKALSARVAQLESAISEKTKVISKQAEQSKLTALFAALESSSELPSQFQASLTTSLTAEQLLTRIEILAGVESADSQLRMTEQVAMLDDKHRGEKADVYYYLKQLLAVSEGSVSADTLARLKAIFAI